ncbi:hypothetical protein SLEP1_g31091 [Rubroshorea leprosula]|uniref:Uncharacterized protein n=1 Tax=Rubroshorea leprosula TaxID=152421 RepID=A0AAV5K2C0_9ROSI|nr:hypothetical protein SLEP1_g31091 [Rubroshorea leprosula]
MDDYDEHCHYAAGLVGLSFSKLSHAYGFVDLAPEALSNSMGLFFQDLKSVENSIKAVQCLNDMVTNALVHVEDCLKYTSALQDPAIFRFGAISLIMHIGLLALFSNNIEIFRGRVKMRRGLAAEVIDRTKTMADVYGALSES